MDIATNRGLPYKKGAYKDLNKCKKETRELFLNQDDFKDKIIVIFREIN